MLAGPNKVVLVIGASAGIGRAVAMQCAQVGARLVLGARREAELQSLQQAILNQGGEAVYLAGDVCDAAYSEALVSLAIKQFGRLDVAVNNAATLGELGSIEDLSLASWQHTLDTNLSSAFLGAKYQLPAMRNSGGGSLIFVSSFVGYTLGVGGMVAYVASKAGLLGLTKVLAAEYGEQGIRVNALLPGGTDTAMGREAAPTPEARAAVASMHALKRMATPEEIAQSVLYLASDASSFTTGAALLADGGMSIYK